MAFVALVSVAFVPLVREDAYDHAIWTVVVVTHPVVTDQHHRHSLEWVSVEAPVIEIVVVIAHAIHVQLLLFLFYQQVEELESILRCMWRCSLTRSGPLLSSGATSLLN